MKRETILFIIFCSLVCPTVKVAGAASYGSVNNGAGTASGSTYKNVISIENASAGNQSSTNYRNYSGFVSGQTAAPAMLVIDNNMGFIDESPVSSEVQTTTGITFKVTLQSSGNNIASVRYRFSNSGLDGLATALDQTDVSTDTIITSGTKIRYKVSFPNAAGQSLSVSDNNYIQWFGKNDAGADVPPAIYRIRVKTAAAPTFAITQPDVKGGYASAQPMIQAVLTDQDVVIDTNTITIKLIKADGTRPVDINIQSSAKPEIYNAGKNLVVYKYDGDALMNNAVYTLTISALDKSGVNRYSAVESFTVKSGAIADLVPYPSPFDPKVQPIAIRYILNKRSSVSINIYDMSGRLVKNVADNLDKEPGVNEDYWTGANYGGDILANGVYFCEVVAKDDDGEHRRYTSLGIFGK